MTKTSEISLATTNDVPGYEVVEVYGEVFGLIVRSRNIFSNIESSLRTIVGGEFGGLTKLLVDSRNKAMERLRQEAAEKGANAIPVMRFDTGDIYNFMNEIAAYGTAVKIQKKKQ